MKYSLFKSSYMLITLIFILVLQLHSLKLHQDNDYLNNVIYDSPDANNLDSLRTVHMKSNTNHYSENHEMQSSNSLKHTRIQQTQHLSIFYSNTHYAASSMPINYTQQILKLSKSFQQAADIDQRINKVQNEYLGHQIQVKILGNFTFKELETNQINCKNTSASIIEALSFRTTEMRLYLENILETNQVNFISNQKQREATIQAISNQIVYLKGLQKYFQSGCSKNIKLSKTYFVSNPNANNWILGNWTYDDFIGAYVTAMNQQKKITKCPIQNPFYDQNSNQCINCQYPNNVWDMKLRKCSACPYAQIVNLKTRRCVSQIRYINNIMDQNHAWITKQVQLKNVYDKFNKQKFEENSVVCPFDTPFILNEKCSFCAENQIYLLEQKRCNPIPHNQKYDKNLHKLVQQLQNYQTNKDISSNVKQNLKSCPARYPYFDNITCIDCVFPNYFNERRKVCQPCLNLQNCGPKRAGFVTNSLASNLTARTTEEVRRYFEKNIQKIKDASVSQCQINTPFYNQQQRKCINCPKQAPIFNISTFKCVSCGQGYSFVQQTYLCTAPKGVKTFSKAQNLLIQDINKYKQEQAKIQGPQCTSDLPYFNGTGCISCHSYQLFNTTSKKCTVCPQGTSYDNVLFKCNLIKYKTNSLTDKLWIANLVEYQSEYKKNIGKQCPIQKPFYNQKGCISCLSDQIFNTTSLKCTKCQNGTIFDNINKNCSTNKIKMFLPGKKDNLVGFFSYPASKYLKEFDDINPKQIQTAICADTENSKKTSCIKCDAKTPYFNVKTLECISCSKYDLQKQVCYDNITYLTKTNDTSKFVGQKQGEVDLYIKNQQEKIKTSPDLYEVCPIETPVVIKNTCQQCKDYYDVNTFSCIKCQNYNPQTKTCPLKEYISNLKYGVPPYYSKNMTKLIQDYQLAKKNGAQICPFSTPFFNGRQCIICDKTDQYFNVDDKKCENCTTSQKFNPIINECQQDPPKYYTSLNSSNLIFDGQPISYYEYKNDQAIKAGSKQCPKQTPYYTTNKRCETCSDPDKYFNMLRRICTHCPQKSIYDQKDHQCQSPIGDIVTPKATLQKSLANLFT